mgnify:CR=1 FL=1
MDEFELIGRFFTSARCARGGPDVALGIGDDCALLQPPPGEQLAISTDTLVSGVHFPAGCDPFALGQRALAVTASDLAGMGARPIGFTLALTLPHLDATWLERFSAGLDAMAHRCQMSLLGGDTTRGPLSMTLTVFGSVPASQALRRDGACIGDLLCVGGSLGEAAAAVDMVLGHATPPEGLAHALAERYWSPMPQLELGRALRDVATAALDISDGLAADCMHIARASGVTLRIDTHCLPVPAALVDWVGESEALAFALSGGDDYRLAFTVPAERWDALHAAWPDTVCIGEVEGHGAAVRLVDSDGVEVTPSRTGYLHFGQHS